jgi:hypothetical protein
VRIAIRSDSTSQPAEATRELAQETWSQYFDGLRKELLYAPISVNIVTPPGPPIMQAKHLPLLALAYDRRDDVWPQSQEAAGACGWPGRSLLRRERRARRARLTGPSGCG